MKATKRDALRKESVRAARAKKRNDEKVRKDNAWRRKREDELRTTLLKMRIFLSKLNVVKVPDSIGFNLGLFIKHQRKVDRLP